MAATTFWMAGPAATTPRATAVRTISSPAIPGINVINGFSGNHLICGGLGKDTLTGGLGLDTFQFLIAPHTVSNHDTITDFNIADDVIQMENTVCSARTAFWRRTCSRTFR
jgi:hypothetical protein